MDKVTKSCVAVAATFSKDPKFWSGDFPVQYLEHGYESAVVDQSGMAYVDWVCGLGANLLGYNYPGFKEALHYAVDLGVAFSLPHKLEYMVAEKLVNLLGDYVPGWGRDIQVRFGLTGTAVCSAAIRLARAYTEKKHVLSFGYHGCDDWGVGLTPPAHGVLEEGKGFVHSIEFNGVLPDMEDVAAVILEHPLVDPKEGWYDYVRKWCDEHGALFIMDEIVTGLRYGMGGACKEYVIVPDLICMGKALGNGVPIAVLAGDRDVMKRFGGESPVFALSNTGNGNTLSLAAANFVLDHWNLGCIGHIREIGEQLKNGLKAAGWNVIGHRERFVIDFSSDAEKGYFSRYMARRGVLANRPYFSTLAHSMGDVKATVQLAEKVREKVDKMGVDGLEKKMQGKLPMVLFRNR